MRVAFVGLGVMGYPMAGHLADAGHEVTVFNRTTSRANKWCDEFGGSAAATPKAAAGEAQVIFSCVGNDDDVRAVLLGDDGVMAGATAGSLVVDHTTASASLARELADTFRAAGVGFVDAPVSGGEAGAQSGQLAVMAGGDADYFRRMAEVTECYAKSQTHIGANGAGQLAKMVNQICIAGVVQGLAEGLHFAEQANLDIDAVMRAIAGGAAQSWQMENRWQTMIEREFEFGFAVDWMRKDLGLTFDEAARNGARLDIAQQIDRYYAEIQQMGGNRWDTSSLIARLGKHRD